MVQQKRILFSEKVKYKRSQELGQWKGMPTIYSKLQSQIQTHSSYLLMISRMKCVQEKAAMILPKQQHITSGYRWQEILSCILSSIQNKTPASLMWFPFAIYVIKSPPHSSDTLTYYSGYFQFPRWSVSRKHYLSLSHFLVKSILMAYQQNNLSAVKRIFVTNSFSM